MKTKLKQILGKEGFFFIPNASPYFHGMNTLELFFPTFQHILRQIHF